MAPLPPAPPSSLLHGPCMHGWERGERDHISYVMGTRGLSRPFEAQNPSQPFCTVLYEYCPVLSCTSTSTVLSCTKYECTVLYDYCTGTARVLYCPVRVLCEQCTRRHTVKDSIFRLKSLLARAGRPGPAACARRSSYYLRSSVHNSTIPSEQVRVLARAHQLCTLPFHQSSSGPIGESTLHMDNTTTKERRLVTSDYLKT